MKSKVASAKKHVHKLSKMLKPSFITAYAKKMSKNAKLSVSLAILLMLVGVWAVVFSNNTSKEIVTEEQVVTELETAPTITATLTLAEGVVELRNEEGDWKDAEVDTELTINNEIRTVGAASRAIVTLEDGSAIRIDANTEVEFESLSQSRVVLIQKSGYIYNRVAPSTTRTYSVHTKNAQFQAIGTAFRTIASGDEEAVEVFHNSVQETSSDKKANEGEKLTVKNPSKPSLEDKIAKIDIEVIKEDTFIIWNRELDLQDPNFKSNLGFLVDFDGPTIDITEPAVGSTIQLDSEATSGSVSIKGKTEGRATLTVQSKSQNGSSPVPVNVNTDGSFETGNLEAPLGNSVFEFIAKDRVGNVSKLNITYAFSRKSAVQEQAIFLTVTNKDEKLNFEWGLVGMTTPDGVYIVGSKTKTPKYPGSTFEQKIKSGTTASFDESDFTSGKKYYFRVCRFNQATDSCDTYSNEVVLEIP